LLGAALERARRVRQAVHAMAGIDLMDREVVGPGMAFDLDPHVLTMDVRGLGITGYQASE
jgi:hypothetical protein